MATSPETTAAAKPTTIASHSTPVWVSVSSLREPYSPAPSVIGVASRKLKRAAASRLIPRARPAVMVAPDRLMPGSKRERLAEADGERGRRRQVAQLAPLAAEPIGKPEAERADHQEAGDRQPRAVVVAVERVLDEALQREADDGRRNGGRDEQPRDAPVRVVADAALAHARQPGADVADPVPREVDEERDQRAEVEEDVEGQAADQPIGLPAGDPRRELEVRRRADRDELGQALEEPDERCLEDDVQDGPSG